MANDKISNEVVEQVSNFFDRYPEAETCYTSGSQLFHANAKNAADMRSAYYGLATIEHTNPKNNAAQAAMEAVENADLVNDVTGGENTEGGQNVPQTNGLTQSEKDQIVAAVEKAQNTEGGQNLSVAIEKIFTNAVIDVPDGVDKAAFLEDLKQAVSEIAPTTEKKSGKQAAKPAKNTKS